jgi:VCBS repeat-containing protein
MKQKNILLVKIFGVISLLFMRLIPVGAVVDVTAGVSGDSLWVSVVPDSNSFDFLQDQQTGSGSVSQDLVGGPIDFGSGIKDYGVFFVQFDDQGSVSTADDELAFRMRLNDADGVKKDTYQFYAFVGLDIDLNGSLDFFLGIYNPDNTGSKAISIYSSDPGKLNISPSTTGFGAQLKEITPIKNNNWSLMAVDDGSLFSGDTDYFISWKYNLTDINDALAAVNPLWVMTVDTPLRMVIGTASQDNSYNQDMGGIEGIDTKSPTTWAELGVFAPVVNPKGNPVVINLAPVAESATYALVPSGTVNFSLHASDPEDDPLSLTPLTQANLSDPSCGTLSGPVDGVYTYIDLGVCSNDVTINFTANDGTHTSDPATITFTLNLPPTANDSSETVDEGEVLESSVTGSDPESKPLTYVLVDAPLYGTLTFNSDGTYTYTHDGSENFEDSFTYYVNDGVLNSNTATVTLTIIPSNDVPTGEPQTIDLTPSEPYNGQLEGLDPEGDDITFEVDEEPLEGELILLPDGSFTFTPPAGQTGTYTFTYRVCDALGCSDPIEVTLTLGNDSLPETGAEDTWPFVLAMGLGLWFLSRKTQTKKTT